MLDAALHWPSNATKHFAKIQRLPTRPACKPIMKTNVVCEHPRQDKTSRTFRIPSLRHCEIINLPRHPHRSAQPAPTHPSAPSAPRLISTQRTQPTSQQNSACTFHEVLIVRPLVVNWLEIPHGRANRALPSPFANGLPARHMYGSLGLPRICARIHPYCRLR